MNLAHLLHRAAKVWGDRPALSVGRSVRLTYAETGRRVPKLAAGLVAAGKLQRGDRVALLLKNCPEYWELLFALWHAGLVAVPVNAKLHPREVAWILDNAGAKLAVVSGALAADLTPLTEVPLILLEEPVFAALYEAPALAVADVAPDDLAWLFYTSGTTGRPKGAMLSHRNLLAATMNYFADVDHIDPQDCIIHCAPISHGSGLYGLPHVARGANQVIPESGGFDPAETLELIAHWPGCSFFFAPTMVHRLVHAPEIATADTSNLKTIVYGGGPMYVADLQDAMRVLGPKLAQIYGQGEAPMTITGMDKGMHVDRGHPRHLARLGSAGVARSDVEVRVVDADDRPLPSGEIGEIICRGDVVMTGYWRNPEATAQTLRNGWLHTGDVGSFDDDGYLTLKDRSKDMIISGGSNIYPREVEEVLLQHPDVAEVSVVGKPHADWGEEVIAFVVRRSGAAVDAAALDALCLDHIARFKRPKQYRFLPALPKNNYGKVLKTELRALLRRRADVADLVYITEHARRTPDKPAIVMAETGAVTTFGQLEAASNRAAQLFRSLGLAPRSHMALLIENRPEFFEVCFGADRAGLYYTPISTRLSAPEIAYICSDSGARVLVITDEFRAIAAELRAQCRGVEHFYMIGGSPEPGYESWEAAVAGMPATPVADEMQGRDMLYSSGTTGKPKGIKRPISGDPVGTRSYFVDNGYRLYDFGPEMRYLNPAPLYHAAPLRYCMLVLRVGGTLVVMQHFDAEAALRLIEAHRITHSNWVPTMFVRMLKLPADLRNRYDLSSHRVAIHGAGPVSSMTKQQMIDWWGPILFEYYAASEGNGMTFITSQDWQTHKGSVGRAIIGELHIVDDETGRELPAGESGLVYFGNGQPFTYHNDEAKTKQAFNDRGWSTLGDIGYVDAEGFLYLTDRKAFMIISGGVNIYPQEAENVLIEHPRVADVAVIGVPNEDFGEEVKAVVQPVDMKDAGPALAEELLAYCRQHLATIKCPRSIDFEEMLPRHPTGKLYKRLIKDRYWGNRTSRIV